ncbi:MAG: prolyl-tRNA synthetase associated domain-containing protein [Deltaproteobacteria bacterium]|nr:prolyl-tRNA synthetase associated domain-containing protein [Deltaproteobacteria bacterium]
MTDIYKFLADHRIEYERHDHPPVFTVEDVHRLVPPLPAAKTKSLFLRDTKGLRHFLIIVRGEKRVNLKALPTILNSSKLDPGSVSIFAAANDMDKAVEIIIDTALWESDAFQFHPLVNTSTLVISRDNIKRFLGKTGHETQVLDVPGL